MSQSQAHEMDPAGGCSQSKRLHHTVSLVPQKRKSGRCGLDNKRRRLAQEDDHETLSKEVEHLQEIKALKDQLDEERARHAEAEQAATQRYQDQAEATAQTANQGYADLYQRAEGEVLSLRQALSGVAIQCETYRQAGMVVERDAWNTISRLRHGLRKGRRRASAQQKLLRGWRKLQCDKEARRRTAPTEQGSVTVQAPPQFVFSSSPAPAPPPTYLVPSAPVTHPSPTPSSSAASPSTSASTSQPASQATRAPLGRSDPTRPATHTSGASVEPLFARIPPDVEQNLRFAMTPEWASWRVKHDRSGSNDSSSSEEL